MEEIKLDVTFQSSLPNIVSVQVPILTGETFEKLGQYKSFWQFLDNALNLVNI